MAELREVVVVDGVRTPIGRAYRDRPERGWLRSVRPDDLSVLCVQSLLERTQVDPASIDDLIFGCANQSGPQGINAARIIGLLAGLPIEVPATTVDRQCASAMTAIHEGAMEIMVGMSDVVISGGFESMSMVPMGSGGVMNPKLTEMYNPMDLPMGATAEKVAAMFNVSREDQDKFSLSSHQKAVAAQEAGKFDDEIISVAVTKEDGSTEVVDKDQCPRANTSLEKLASLPPAFKQDGIVTAGNSSPLNDGAAAVLLMSKEKARELGLKPLATIREMAVAGVDPTIMGVGPVPASKKALAQAGLTIDDIDLMEINEAFASQSLYCVRELGMDTEKVNVNGGAIALGHPLGCSGTRIVVTLLHELARRGGRYGLATMCVGFGMGAATIFEREEY